MSNAVANTGPPDGHGKRPRPVISCLECRRKKLKCDRLLPCQQCQKRGRTAWCSYADGSAPGSRGDIPTEEQSSQPAKKARSIAGSEDDKSYRKIGVIEDLQNRVTRLEAQLSSQTAAAFTPSTRVNDLWQDPVTRLRHQHENGQGTPALINRYQAHRQRITLLESFKDAQRFMSNIERNNEDGTDMGSIVDDLRKLQRVLKYHRRTHKIAILEPVNAKMVELLPDKDTVKSLVDLYFDNYENCHRILHRQSFLAEVDAFLRSRENNGAEFSDFIPTLLAVLSIASSLEVTPDCFQVALHGDELQPSAVDLILRWIHSLEAKQRYTFRILQLQALTLLPQKGRTGRIDDLWTSSGMLVRHAMAIKLHEDPSTLLNTSPFEAELRRRLWTSIMEQELTMSLMCGMPTMLSLDQYTCGVPINVNDADLHESMKQQPRPRPSTEWTDSLCQTVLANSFSLRLEAYKTMSNHRNGISYEQVMGYSRSLEKALQDLPAPLRFNYAPDNKESGCGRLWARVTLDIFIRRSLLNLYTPFAFASSGWEDNFSEARVAYLRSSLVLLSYQDLFDPKFSDLNVPLTEGYWDMFYKLYRHDVIQTCLGLCHEIQRLGQGRNPTPRPTNGGDSGKRPPWTRPSLIKTVEDTIEPIVRHIARPGLDAKDLLCLIVVFHSVRTTQPSDVKEKIIREGVGDMIQACQRQLQKDGVTMTTPASHSDNFESGLTNWASIPDQFFDLSTFNFGIPSFQYVGLDEWSAADGYGDWGPVQQNYNH